MIYDCFTFFNELDLLEIRLRELAGTVDTFVLVEADKTFTGKPKELYFEKNKKRFAEFQDKIIHVVVRDMPAAPQDAWEMEHYQRNAIMRGLHQCQPDDYVIISDVDEIPSAEAIKGFSGRLGILDQRLFYYKLNCLCVTGSWQRSVIVRKALLSSPQAARNMATDMKQLLQTPLIANGGWHFSYLGDEDTIQNKINSFSHQEYNREEYNKLSSIAQKSSEGLDLFGRSDHVFRFVPIDKSFPQVIFKNPARYAKMIHPLTEAEKKIFTKEKPLLKFLRTIEKKRLAEAKQSFLQQEALQEKNEILARKEKEIEELTHALKGKHDEVLEMKRSLRWRVPNYFYELYKGKLKKFIPKKVFVLVNPLAGFLRKVSRRSIFEARGHIFEIEPLKFGKLDKIMFSQAEQEPRVSIVIPVFNKWKYTYHCLKYLARRIHGISYEVIVVDNASTDETEALFRNNSVVMNAVYIKNKKNLGFVGGCNAGARASRGEFIVFLNNDTEVLAGWLEGLLKAFEEHPDAGLVGSKLIYPDGRLQEAGGIVWKTKRVWNYGRFADPDSYEFNYFKEADYCSAASIMIRGTLFNKLGGFDELYAPAYFEDTDLAFRVRKAGFKVYYQPLSEVVHFEGVTAGTDVKEGLKRYQELNCEKFFARWKDELEHTGLDDSADGPFLARDRSGRKKVLLFVEHAVPAYDKDAGSFIVFEYLKIIANLGYKVIFWPQNLAESSPYTEILQQKGIEVVYGKKRDVSFESFISNNGRLINTAIVSRPEVAHEFIPLIKKHSSARVLYMAQDLHFLREERELAVSNPSPDRKKLAETNKLKEISLMKQSDGVLLYSDAELKIMKEKYPEIPALLLPWVQDICGEAVPGFSERGGLLFLGSSHPPNTDGVCWFHREVFPLIKKEIPDVGITIVGKLASDEVLKLNKPDFKIVGFVADVSPYFNAARVFVSPLRYGAGFKGKNAMAMGYGLPLVTTDVGGEGMSLKDGKTVLIANDAKSFARAVVRLYSERKLWERISAGSLEHVRKNFSKEKASNRIREILEN